ncbi:MAG: DNA repair protein RadC [Bacteroidetes bacterium]|nr:DNA repair protein RadC [Bacteroidota bacterium]
MRSRPNSAPIPLWPVDERPREKLLRQGIHTLSDAELLALILRTGSSESSALDLARTLLVRERSLRTIGSRTPGELMRQKGIGPAKALELLAAFEIGRRAQAEQEEVRPVFRSPEDVARRMVPLLRDRKTEVFYVLVMDAKNALKIDVELSVGTLNASLVHPREVYKVAIDNGAAAIIVVHNHPSGNPEPSNEDVEITRQLAEAGKIIGIPLHDHMIVAGDRSTSLAERGLL